MRSRALLGLIVAVLTGCAHVENPSFPVTATQARRAIADMRAAPKPLERPLVIVGGFLDFNVSPPLFGHFFRSVTTDGALIIPVSVGTAGSFDECRRRVIAAVDAAAPSTDARFTTEVDVVGASLGGLVARYAADPARNDPAARRLRVARLFTISSPHDGATLAQHAAFTDYHRDMLPDSRFIKSLAANDATASYELVPYVHLGNEIVGETHAAPAGRSPYWLSNDSLLLPHAAAMVDARILADIARRLRGEAPFTRPPPAALPAVAARD